MISFRAITKTFAGVTALDNVSLTIARGEVHAIMGENGAGKSTLGKILAGIHRPTAGEILLDGQSVTIRSPLEAARLGIGMVHQELAFCPDLSVAENLALGHYPRRAGIFVSRQKMAARARELLAQIGAPHLDVSAPMRQLSTAQEQLVQIASAIGTGARVLIFDEPTSSLAETESQQLFSLIETLRARGVTILYVSHRMPEVFRLADRISVLRDGRYVGTLAREQATQDRLVQLMIGRTVQEYFARHADAAPGPVVLDVRNLASPGKFRDVSFQVRAGEIVGFAGLVGSGRSEIAQAIFGLDPDASGQLLVGGQPLRLGRVRQAMAVGLALVPEDRKRQGLVLGLSCRANFALPLLDRLSRLGFVRRSAERNLANQRFEQLRIKTPSLNTPVAALSGGNQQKVVLAKWLARGGKVLLVDEPTRGVDVAAKAAIHALLDELAQRGAAIMLISSELPEVLNLSSRILVMREGRLVGQLTRGEATQECVLRRMAGMGEVAFGPYLGR